MKLVPVGEVEHAKEAIDAYLKQHAGGAEAHEQAGGSRGGAR
jgi:hypothetical protein